MQPNTAWPTKVTVLLFCVCFLFSSRKAFSQNQVIDFATVDEPENELFRTRHWELLFHLNGTQQALLTHGSNAKYLLFTRPQISYEFGVQRLTNLNKNLGLEIGLRVGLVGRNAAYVVPFYEVSDNFTDSSETYPITNSDSRDRDILYFSIPFNFEYRIFQTPTLMYLIDLGASLRFAGFNSTKVSGAYTMDLNLDGHKSPIVNVNFGLGSGFLLRNKDIFKCVLSLNYDPFYLARGNYILETKSSYDAGTYTLKGSSIGLVFTYERTAIRSLIRSLAL
jgi:hypothetical protein